MKCTIICLLSVLTLSSPLVTKAQEYYVKEVIFPEGATVAEKVDMASRLVPSPKQLAWQDLELTAFLHFGINTFTDREWGDGKEDPAIFNPDDLDTDQWVKALKDAGFKMAILTAKHHDGFCLWPSNTTKHTVASSSWLDGKGDVVKKLSESCHKYGIKLGLYLSPWDRNAECYGDSPKYNDMFVDQLTEILTNYGTVDEVWFDGACGEGPNGKKQEYDWARFKETIETLQPNAVMAIMGDDVRWVGNERGLGRETEWNATAITPGILPGAEQRNKALGLTNLSKDLGSRRLIAKADRLYWWPSEVDVSIRPGWFYHESQQPKSLRELADIYINSVGRNSVLLLNIPPDTHGLIADVDVKRLNELREWIDDNFGTSVGQINGLTASLNVPANAIVLGEDISKGQRVEEFEVEARIDGKWEIVAEGTTIGKKRIMLLEKPSNDAIRVNILRSRGEPNVSILGVHDVKLPKPERKSLPDGYRRLAKDSWQVTNSVNGTLAIDDDESTLWISTEGTDNIIVDLGSIQKIDGFAYTPRQDGNPGGIIFKYKVNISTDGQNWEEIPTTGEFSNIANNPISQIVYFDSPVEGRYLKLQSLETTDGSNAISVAEIDAITK